MRMAKLPPYEKVAIRAARLRLKKPLNQTTERSLLRINSTMMGFSSKRMSLLLMMAFAGILSATGFSHMSQRAVPSTPPPCAVVGGSKHTTLKTTTTTALLARNPYNYNEGQSPWGLKKNGEIWNGRVAMMAFAWIFIQELFTGKGVIQGIQEGDWFFLANAGVVAVIVVGLTGFFALQGDDDYTTD